MSQKRKETLASIHKLKTNVGRRWSHLENPEAETDLDAMKFRMRNVPQNVYCQESLSGLLLCTLWILKHLLAVSLFCPCLQEPLASILDLVAFISTFGQWLIQLRIHFYFQGDTVSDWWSSSTVPLIQHCTSLIDKLLALEICMW